MGQKLSRRLSPTTLFMLSMNAIIGSGWLFAPLYAAKAAGPAVLVSWGIGGVAAILIALTFAELSTMLPVSGGSAHIPQLSHGAFASFMLSWVAWITSLMLAPIEVQAVMQYASLYFPALMHVVDGTPHLTMVGLIWAAILMLTLCMVNIFSYNGLVRFNFIIFIFKFSVIVLTILAIFMTSFHPGNFAGMGSAMMTSGGWQAILSAVSTGGIVLAFNGFKSGVELAGEAKNLSLSIPLSTVGAVLGCLLVYMGLQVCFIGALEPSTFANGWHDLNFSGDIGPFVGLAAGLGIWWLLKLLYANAVVSPLGAGLIYVTSTARILYAISKMGYVPKFVSKLNKHHFPVWAIVINFVLGMMSFLPLPGWQSMVNFLISTIVITYAIGPIALMSFRYSMPDRVRPFRLPMAGFVCLLSFYCCNLFCYWTGWETISKLSLVLGIGLILFFVSYLRGNVRIGRQALKSASWLVPYLLGLVIISYLGAFGGGHQVIPFGIDFMVIGIFSLGIFYMAVRTRVPLSEEELGAFLLAES